MAIQMRRGNQADLDISKLKAGEIAVCLDTKKMIVKLTANNYLTLSDMPELREIVNSKADSNHNHDDRYYTKSEIDTKLSSKANRSDVYYYSGDELTGAWYGHGYLTSSSKDIIMSFPLPKRTDLVSSLTIIVLKLAIRKPDGGYLGGSSYDAI